MAIYKSIYSGPQIDEGITKANEAATVESVNTLTENVLTNTTAINNLTNRLNETNENVASNLESIVALAEGKQEKLTAGDNITIQNNVISATGGGATPSKTIITGNIVNETTSDLGVVLTIQLSQSIADFENTSISASFDGIPFVLNHLKSNVFNGKVFVEQYATTVYFYGFYHEVDGAYVLYATYSSIDGITIPKDAQNVNLTLIEYTFYKDAIINELLFVITNVDGSGEGQTFKLHSYNSLKAGNKEWYDAFTIYYALVGFIFVSFLLIKTNDIYNGTIIQQNCNFTNGAQTN